MSNTFLTWVIVASVAALGLLLFFGLTSVDSATQETTPSTVGSAVGDESSSTSYWQPVAGTAYSVSSSPVYSNSAGSVPCTACAAQQAQAAAPRPAAVSAPVVLVGGCGQPSVPCGSTPCASIGCASSCSAAPSCGQAVCGERPQINRNMPLCVDECGFLQLHSTVPQPTCREVRFEWTASKGHFLDPTAADPLYFAPTSYFPGGEDVWIGLTVIDAQGIRYADQVHVHVNNVK
jgi:hypothetical protein